MKTYKGTFFLLLLSVALQVLFSIAPALIDWFAFTAGSPLAPLTAFTALVSHASWEHLIGNFTIGLPFLLFLEHKLGHPKFLEFYIIAGVAGSLLNLLIMGGAPCIGSSGAIFGCITGACSMFGSTKEEHYLGLGLMAAFLIPQLMMAPFATMIHIAIYAHIGGGLAGILLAGRLYKPTA